MRSNSSVVLNVVLLASRSTLRSTLALHLSLYSSVLVPKWLRRYLLQTLLLASIRGTPGRYTSAIPTLHRLVPRILFEKDYESGRRMDAFSDRAYDKRLPGEVPPYTLLQKPYLPTLIEN